MKFLILIILALISVNSFASGISNNLEVGKTLKVSNNYLTPDSFVDGSFESSTASWTINQGALATTAAEKFTGNQSGVWTITGAGTIDLCTNLSSISNTMIESSAYVKSSSANVSVCSYSNSLESGCSTSSNVTGWTKLSSVSIAYGGVNCIRIKNNSSGAQTIYIDNAIITPNSSAWKGSTISYATTKIVNEDLSTPQSTGSPYYLYYSSYSLIEDKVNGSTVTQGTGNVTITGAKDSVNGLKVKANRSGLITICSNIAKGNTTYINYIYKNGSQFLAAPYYEAGSVQKEWCFQDSAVNGDYYQIASANGFAGISNFTNIQASLISQNDYVMTSYGNGVEWTSYTPTILGFGTPTSIEFQWKRIGSDVLIRGRFSPSGTSGVEARISLPSGLTSASSTVIPSLQIAGQAESTSSGSVYFGMSTLMEPSVTYFTLGYQSSTTGAFTKALGSGTTSSPIAVTARIPIDGWSEFPKVFAVPQIVSTDDSSSLGYVSAYYSNDAGHGSSASKVPCLPNVDTANANGFWSVAQNGTIGHAITATKNCLVAKIEYTQGNAGGSNQIFGITKNSTNLSSNYPAVSASQRLTLPMSTGPTGELYQSVVWYGSLVSGDVIRGQDSGNSIGTLTWPESFKIKASCIVQ